MDSSSECEFFRSFGEYDSSGLENDSTTEFGTEHPLTKAITTVMNNKLSSNGTLTSATNVVKMLNEMPGSQIKLPTDRNVLKKVAVLRYQQKNLVFCEKCNELCNESGRCCACDLNTKKTKTNFFIYIPLEQQIRNTLDNHFDSILEHLDRQRGENISDIDDGVLHKRACEKHPNSIVLSFTLNTDGCQLHNSQKKSVWPVQLYQNFLPPHLRFKSENILLVALYFEREKPDGKKLLYPLCKEMEKLVEDGIAFYRSGRIYHCIPVITNCSLDLPARKILSGLKLYSGKYACITCLHEGVSVTDHLKQKYIRYIRLTPKPPQRTHESIIKAVKTLSTKRSRKVMSIEGVTEIPAMLLFDGFDLSCGFSIDYMHNALIGIMGMLLDFWMGTHRLSKNSQFFKPMTPENRTLLDTRLLALKPFEKITRKPKTLKDRKFFKASEYRNLLLYYLPLCLEGLLDQKLLNHFKLLSGAIYILLKPEISTENLLAADRMLVSFADEFEELYGAEAVTMNIHNLRHYRESVENSGPLWASSVFGFESNIGVLCKASKNCKTDEIESIAFNYCLKRAEKTDEPNIVTLMRGKLIELPSHIAALLLTRDIKPTNGRKFFAGDAVKINLFRYKSINSKETKSVDHFVEIKDGTIGSVYIYIKFENQIYLVLQEYDIIEISYHLRKIKPLQNFKIYSLNDIACKILYMKFSTTEFVTKEPNRFENYQ